MDLTNQEQKFEIEEFSEKNRSIIFEQQQPLAEKKDREQWSNKIEYMLSVIGYVVDLGNCVRFPYVTYKNGGGAFLVPYFFFLVVIGVPMMFLEMAVAQYFHCGNITLWGKVNIYMKGIGYSSLLVVSFITLYYSTIIAYSVYYLLETVIYLSTNVPWSTW
jgi:SNF family Na+-dependent transporter